MNFSLDLKEENWDFQYAYSKTGVGDTEDDCVMLMAHTMAYKILDNLCYIIIFKGMMLLSVLRRLYITLMISTVILLF